MLMKERRSIRKYQEKQVPRELVDKIVEAGLYAPNAGGGQRSMIVTLHNAELAKKLGKLNFSTFDRSKLIGGHVSDEQPSVIDDPNIKNGFYDLCDFRAEGFSLQCGGCFLYSGEYDFGGSCAGR